MLDRDNAGDQYEPEPSIVKPRDVQHRTPATPQTKSPNLAVKKHTNARDGERSLGFNSRILGVSKLICPQCAIEALVEPGVNIICGNCRVWMQVDEA